ncbi:oxygen-sensing cyclic-di-GMP phosphodiesterase DosP [Azorhizophilus paspali]|uniref:oxygen-sensing cyclic-di-GMP phosphodiesterase DosP n=1 Tax=Azorhizophilus paspali TaxID=69963 RepID=UPI00366EF40E
MIVEVEDVPLAALDRSALVTALIDERNRVVFFSQAAERLWGLGRDEVLGRDAGLVLSPGLSSRGDMPSSGPDLPGSGQTLAVKCRDGRQIGVFFSRSAIEIDGRLFHLLVALSPEGMPDGVMGRTNRQLFMAIDHTDQPMLVFNAQRQIVHVNRAFTESFGYELGEVLGLEPMAVFLSPNVSAEDLVRYRGLPWGRERFQTEMLVRRKNGSDFWVHISSSPFDGDEVDELNGYSVDILADITEEWQIRSLEHEVLEALTSSLSFEEVGNCLCRCIEAIAPGVIASVWRIAEGRIRPWAAPQFPPECRAAWDGVEIGEGVGSCGTTAYRGEPVVVRDIASDTLWASYKHLILPYGLRACWSYPVKRRDGSVAGTFAFYFREGRGSDSYLERIAEASVHLCVLAIEREEDRQQMNRLVQLDTLTGLPNRSHLLRRIDELLVSATWGDIACFNLGLDRFKDINEALGHAEGDQVLVAMANRLQRHLRPGQFLSRSEGDLFVIVAPDCDVHGASLMAERLLQTVAEPIVEVGGHALNLSASVGISLYPEGGQDRDALLANAKSAMYRVKRTGGDGYQFFIPEMNRALRDRLLLSAALKRAIASNGLSLHYQPQVYTVSGELYGFEALARWHDDEFGEIPPAKFIGLAEETGQIEAIGRWALREACRQLAEWRKAGAIVPTVSVNLSPINFHSRDLPEFVAGLLHEFALSGPSLTIEITESTMMALTPEMLDIVHGIRSLGVGLSVDDFGTGFSSLSNLINLPVTEVKIDRSFIDKCLEENRLQSLVAAVVGIGFSLDLTVVAEGVETREQRDLLSEYRCPVLQGYIFSRPMSPCEAFKWLFEGGGEPLEGCHRSLQRDSLWFREEVVKSWLKVFYPVLPRVLDALPLAVSWAAIPGAHIQYGNRAFDQLFGYPSGHFQTANQLIEEAYIHERQRDLLRRLWNDFALPSDASGLMSIPEVEVDILAGDGQMRTVLHWGLILPEQRVAIAFYKDISDFKRDSRLLSIR